MADQILIYTSNYDIAGEQPNAIGISRGTPPAFKGDTFKHLVPPPALAYTPVKSQEEWEKFTALYHALVLAKLDPIKVAKHLNGKILLCWEKPHEYCHRMVIARWLIEETRAMVLEWEKPGKTTMHVKQESLF